MMIGTSDNDDDCDDGVENDHENGCMHVTLATKIEDGDAEVGGGR